MCTFACYVTKTPNPHNKFTVHTYLDEKNQKKVVYRSEEYLDSFKENSTINVPIS